MRRPHHPRHGSFLPVFVATLAGILLTCAAPQRAASELEVSPNQRYLQDADTGEPFFLTGDAAWSLLAELSVEEAVAYLDDRAARGFNLLMVNLIEHAFSSNPPQNADGDPPFVDEPFGTPNEAYFAHVDQVMAAAQARSIVVLLAPVYLGYGCGSQGWCQEVETATLSQMREWGRYVGGRYGAFDNVLWLIGGDTDPSPVAEKMREVVAGIRELDPVHLITAHNQPETQAIDPWPAEDWLAINSVYTYSNSLYDACRQAYEVAPTRPYFLLESAYENEHSTTPRTLRAQSYWAALSGAFGHVFGNCPIWHFGSSAGWCGLTDWEDALDAPGSVGMQHYRELFESRRWTELVPDIDELVLVGGTGSYGSADYATAAHALDGSSILAYLPGPRTVTVDPAVLSGDQMRAWWYDPASGTASEIGVFPRQIETFASPPGEDWVLVIDDADLGFPPPGDPPAPSQAPESTSKPESELGLRVARIHPQPFRDRVTVELERAENSGSTRLRITDVKGRVVREMTRPAGSDRAEHFEWDGRNAAGAAVPAGVYLFQAISEGHEVKGRLVRAR